MLAHVKMNQRNGHSMNLTILGTDDCHLTNVEMPMGMADIQNRNIRDVRTR